MIWELQSLVGVDLVSTGARPDYVSQYDGVRRSGVRCHKQ
jgi:hypothetical protein